MYQQRNDALKVCGRVIAIFEFSDLRVRRNLDRDLPRYTLRFNVVPETSPNIPVIVCAGVPTNAVTDLKWWRSVTVWRFKPPDPLHPPTDLAHWGGRE